MWCIEHADAAGAAGAVFLRTVITVYQYAATGLLTRIIVVINAETQRTVMWYCDVTVVGSFRDNQPMSSHWPDQVELKQISDGPIRYGIIPDSNMGVDPWVDKWPFSLLFEEEKTPCVLSPTFSGVDILY